MKEKNHLLLGKGIGEIVFGMSRNDIENILGKPDEVESIRYSDDERSVTWYYYDKALDFTFDSTDDYKLSYITTDSNEYHIEKKIKVGLKYDELLDFIEELELGLYDIEDMSSEDLQHQLLISFDSKSLNLWFDNKVLTEIQFGPFYDEDDKPQWP